MLEILADSNSSPLFVIAPEPFDVARGPNGHIWFTDISNHRIFRIDRNGGISVAVGNGIMGNDGDGEPALDASINEPLAMRFADGALVFSDRAEHCIRRLDLASGRLWTVAGTGQKGFTGDGAPARSATFCEPHGIDFDERGHLYIVDSGNHRIRRIAAGNVETVAGTGLPLATHEGPADLETVSLNAPRAIAFEPTGAALIALRDGNAIYRIYPETETTEHIAGNGRFGYTGDGGRATDARLANPRSLALGPGGQIIFADTDRHTIRCIDRIGTVHTLVGNGFAGESTDPRDSCLDAPRGLFVDRDGSILIADSGNRRLVRMPGPLPV